MTMNGIPMSIFTSMRNYIIGKAEKAFDRSAACKVEQGGKVYRMYVDLSDDCDFERTFTCEVLEGGKVIESSKFTEYGGAKRAHHAAPKMRNPIAARA